MEKLNELIYLLPDYELEGFPRSLADEKAAAVLSGWISLWHPVLICGAGRIPRWHQATRLPSELASTLFVLSPISEQAISSTAAEEISKAGGILLRPTQSWVEFQSQILSHFPQLEINPSARDLVADFAALGYAFLQVQLMTRQLRYTSNLDVALFEEQVLKATEAVMESDTTRARELLQVCFDTLGQERDHYYSNDAYLVDLTLLAESTLGKSLQSQLSNPLPTSFVASASILKKASEKSPDSFNLLKQRLTDGSAAIAGGLEVESPLPLASRESAVRLLARSASAYRELGVDPPSVFARMSFGLTADSPSLLSNLGFRGAILMAFSGGKYPACSQTKISWESQDGSRIAALAGEPLDASGASSFLSLGWNLGEALDRQHVPTLVFAHWPAKSCEYFDLLRIVAQRTPALGRFVLVDRYFADTSTPYHHERLDANSFSFNWLAEAENPGNLIEACKQAQILQCRLTSLRNLSNLVWQLKHRRNKAEWPKDDKGECQPPRYQLASEEAWAQDLAGLGYGIDSLLDSSSQALDRVADLHRLADDAAKKVVAALIPLLTSKKNANTQVDDVELATGKLLINPRSNAVRVLTRSKAQQALSSTESWFFAAGADEDERATCIDLPSMGFVAAAYDSVGSATRSDKLSLADADGMLRNEFVEVQIDTQRGHLRSLHIPSKRGNRLSAMIAFRTKSGSKFEHSEMVAKHASLVTSSSMLGCFRTEGYLNWQGSSVAEFCIDFELQRGSRILSANIRLSQLKHSPEKNPWLSAFILRLAWPTEAAILRTFPDGRRTTWSGTKLVAPDLIEIDEADYKTHYLTGGLAFHGRQELRILETILAVHGQQQVEHKIGIAVDLPHPLPTSQQLVDRPYECQLAGNVATASGWLVAVDSKAVLVDLCSPLHDDQASLVGIRVLVSELQGRSITANVQFFRDIAEASRVDYAGNRVSRVTASGDTLTIALRANEQSWVDILWS